MTDTREHEEFRVRLAVIEEKIDSGFKRIEERFIRQDEVDTRQDKKIDHLEEVKASKADIVHLEEKMDKYAAQFGGLIVKFMGSGLALLAGAILTKIFNMW